MGAIDDFSFLIENDQLGFALIDESFVVRARRGALAGWLPAPGLLCVESGLLFAMESALAELRAPETPPLVLPSVRAADGERVNISIDWNPAKSLYVVLVTPDASAEQWDRLLVQQRRERQVLQQQAAAAADRLRVSDTLYRDIVEATDDAVLRLRPDLTLSFVSGPAAALIGMRSEAALGRPTLVILPLPPIHNPWRADMCAAGAASFDQPLRRPDGEMRWLWWNVRWLGDDGGPREFQAVGRDITELRRLRAELERANEAAKVAALAEERLRIAHDLHDTFIDSLVATMARLSLLRRAAPEGPMRDKLLEAEQAARAGLRSAREAVGAIRSPLAFPDGPAPPLIAAAEALAKTMPVRVEIDDDFADLAPAQTLAIVRVAREALRNVSRHSGASGALLSLTRSIKTIELEIVDDGVGFDPDGSPSGHYGLVGMREQAAFAGGVLAIGRAPAGGVSVKLTIPDGWSSPAR